MRKQILTLCLICLVCLYATAETNVYFQNNTDLAFNITYRSGGGSLSLNKHYGLPVTSVPEYGRKRKILWTNRDSGISSGVTFWHYLTVTPQGIPSHALQLGLKIKGSWIGSSIWHEFAVYENNAAVTSTGLKDNRSIHRREFTMNGKKYQVSMRAVYTSGFDDIVYVLDEVNYNPVPAADYSNPHVLNAVSYNIYGLFAGSICDRHSHVAKKMKTFEVVGFQEAFDNSCRTELKNSLKADGWSSTKVTNSSAFPEDGGSFIATRYPILEEDQIIFSSNNSCNFTQANLFAAKGVNYAKINKLGEIYHVFNTHLYAGNTSGCSEVRNDQLKLMYEFIQRKTGGVGRVIMLGDFNIGGGSQSMLESSLGAYIPAKVGPMESSHGKENVYGSGDGSKLDYVLFMDYNDTQKSALYEPVSHFQLIFCPRVSMVNNSNESENTEWADIFADLSDHYPVYGRFEYNNTTNQRFSRQEAKLTNLSLTAYPNPTTRFLYVKLEQGIDPGKIEIINTMGMSVGQNTTVTAEDEQLTIDVSQLKKGIYFLRIPNQRNQLRTTKFVVN